MVNKLFVSNCSITEFYEANKDKIGEELIILDSPLKSKLARYSYIFFNIKKRIIIKNKEIVGSGKKIEKSIFKYLEKEYENQKKLEKEESREEFFTKGAFIFFSYDFGREIERLPDISKDDLKIPDVIMMFPSEVIIKNEETGEFFYTGKNNSNWNIPKNLEIIIKYKDIEKKEAEKFRNNMSREYFYSMVEKAKHYIVEGDIFQVNLSQRFEADFKNEDSFELYKILRKINPSPFASFVRTLDFTLISQSPERLIRVSKDRKADTRPIAGTRRFREKEAAEMEKELLLSEKERAEHVMLVDLERNDLGKVCKFGTVNADEFMVIERYSHVMHIVSNVIGELRDDVNNFEVVKAMFPGGTITGAPKIRSMEIIEELEPTKRGAYTGSLGYLDFSGKMDLNIIIRSFVEKNNKIYFQTGAGIVYDSEPEKEYNETINKARAMILAYKNYMAGGE